MLSLCIAISNHMFLPGNWNEIHPCVRYEQDGWIAGAYLNSEMTLSAYVGHEWSSGNGFAEAGVVTGYSGHDILPFARIGIEKNNVKYFIAPGVADGAIGVVLGVEYVFN